MKKPWKRILFASVSVLLALGACEVLLQGLCLVSPRFGGALFRVDPSIPDPRLRSRPNPRYPGHDAKGFRNASVLEQAEIVALGDSQTYGAGVDGAAAWLAALARLSGRAVYSMAGPGFGPGHSLILLDDALALSPQVVIEAFYSGNDLFDAFYLAYHQGSLEEMKSSDSALIQALEKAEAEESLESKALRTSGAKPEEEPQRAEFSLRGFLGKHSALYALVRAVRRLGAHRDAAPDWEAVKARALRRPEIFQIVEAGAVKRILMPAYRLSVLDQDDPRVAEGLRIALESLVRMHARLREKGVDFVVLFLPTAELVFEPAVRESGVPLTEAYSRLLACEKKMWSETRQLLNARSIRFIDAIPALEDALKRGEQPYPASSDGHPNEAGHAAIAKVVHDSLFSR